MWIRAKLHSAGAPTIIRINPFLNANGIGRVNFLRNYRVPSYKVEALRIHPRPAIKWYDEIQWDWRRWVLKHTMRLINSVSFSLTLMAQDGVARRSMPQTGLAAVRSAINRWWKHQQASWAKRMIRLWERWEDDVIDELYTTH